MGFKHHAYCTFPNFRGISFGSVHYSILSRNGASDKPGAIHRESRPAAVRPVPSTMIPKGSGGALRQSLLPPTLLHPTTYNPTPENPNHVGTHSIEMAYKPWRLCLNEVDVPAAPGACSAYWASPLFHILKHKAKLIEWARAESINRYLQPLTSTLLGA